MDSNVQDAMELFSVANQLNLLHMELQQLKAKFTILNTAIAPFSSTQIKTFAHIMEELAMEQSKYSGVAHLLGQLARSKAFIEKFEADLESLRKKDGTISPK